jgi:cell filamentation protein
MIATIYAAQGVMDQLVDFFEQTIEWPQMGMRMT